VSKQVKYVSDRTDGG